ncbi:MAG: FixH family protein [Agarilytica sp.]
MNQECSEQKWYQEPWCWFVLSPMIVVFVVSSIFITLAVKGADDKVSDNYYKEGRMLAQESSSEAYAKSLGLEADVKLDRVSGEIIVGFNQDVDVDVITLLVSHPAKSELDVTLTLNRIDARRFRSDLDGRLDGRWYLRMISKKSDQESWRLHGELDLHQSDTAQMN